MIEVQYSKRKTRARVVDEFYSTIADEDVTNVLTGWMKPEKAIDAAIKAGALVCERCSRLAVVRRNSAGQSLRLDAMYFQTDHKFCAECDNDFLNERTLRDNMIDFKYARPEQFRQLAADILIECSKHLPTYLLEKINDRLTAAWEEGANL